MVDILRWMCFECYEKQYPNRQHGLTSRVKQPCIVCSTIARGVLIEVKEKKDEEVR